MKDVGTISITLEGASYETTERCRRIIHLLFQQGFFNLRNGEAVVSFDSAGNPGSIRFDYVKWKGDKSSAALDNLYDYARIEIRKPDAQKTA